MNALLLTWRRGSRDFGSRVCEFEFGGGYGSLEKKRDEKMGSGVRNSWVISSGERERELPGVGWCRDGESKTLKLRVGLGIYEGLMRIPKIWWSFWVGFGSGEGEVRVSWVLEGLERERVVFSGNRTRK